MKTRSVIYISLVLLNLLSLSVAALTSYALLKVGVETRSAGLAGACVCAAIIAFALKGFWRGK